MKTIMVDLDDTLVSFSEMFCDTWNRYIRTNARYFTGANHTFTIDDVCEYDFLKSLKKFYENKGVKGLYSIDDFYEHCMYNIIFIDDTFYDNPYLTPEFHKIFNMLMKNYKDYKKILHTKISTPEMMIAKAKLFKSNKQFDIFDEIIVDMEKGMNHTPKPFNYDVMVDDAPHNIDYYLKNNPSGIVYMPLRKYNESFKDMDRVIVI